MAHRLAHRLAVAGGGPDRRDPISARRRADARSRRLMADSAHHRLGHGLGDLRVGHLRGAGGLWSRLVLNAHGHAHDPVHGGSDPDGACRSGHPRPADPDATSGPYSGTSRAAAGSGAFQILHGDRQSGRGRRHLLRQPDRVLLLAVVRLGPSHPHRAHPDDDPLPVCRVPLRVGARRDRPRAQALATRVLADHPLRHDLVPGVLWCRPDQRHDVAGTHLLPRPASDLDGGPAGRPAHRWRCGLGDR